MQPENKQNGSKIQDSYENEFNSYGKKESKPSESDPNNEQGRLNDITSRGGDKEPPWANNVSADKGGKHSSSNAPASILGKGKSPLAKKKNAGLLLVFGGIATLAFIFIAFFSSMSSMLISLVNNASSENNYSSRALSGALPKALNHLVNGSSSQSTDSLCKISTSARCRGGKLTNSALNSLSKKGVVAVFDDGTKYDGSSKKGMPGKSIKEYVFTGDNGKSATVKSDKLKTHLNANPGDRSKILGVRGAWNAQFRATTSKFIQSNHYTKYGINKAGGIIRQLAKPFKSSSDRLKATKAAVKAKVPALSKVDDMVAKFSNNLSDKTRSNFRKGGVIYGSAVAGCIASKIPTAVATAAAAAEMARLISVAHEAILSPGSYAQGAGMFESGEGGFTPEAAEAVGSLLTATDENGKAPVDSKYLLAAIGVNTTIPGISKFSPGIDVLENSALSAGMDISSSVKGLCNVVLSPLARYTAVGVNTALNGSGIGALVNIAGGLILGQLASALVERAAQFGMESALKVVLDQDKLDGLVGEEAGDMYGTALKVAMSTLGQDSGVSASSVGSISSVAAVNQKRIAEERAMDIASLSPFDISSKNTFMGSILYNARLAMVKNGGLSNNILTRLVAFARIPASFASLATTTAGAAVAKDSSQCVGAAKLGLDSDDPYETPCIDWSLSLVTGFTEEQDNMSYEAMQEALEERGWINLDAEISETADTKEFLDAIIVKDTPIDQFVNGDGDGSGSCMDSSSGSHIDGTGICMTMSSDIAIGDAYADEGTLSGITVINDDSTDTTLGSAASLSPVEKNNGNTTGPKKYSDAFAMNAISPFVVTVNALTTIQGNNDPVYSGDGGSILGNEALAGDVVKTAVAFSHPGMAASMSSATGAYEEALKEYGISNGKDCGRFIGAILHASGADTDFPLDGSTQIYGSYMSSSDKYERISATSETDLKPGDIFTSATRGHILMYVGPDAATDGGKEIAQASYGTNYGHRGQGYNDGLLGIYEIYRLK